MKLEDDSTHFKCAGCSKIKLIKEGRTTKVAYSITDRNTQNSFQYRPCWVMLCDKCFRGEKKKKDD